MRIYLFLPTKILTFSIPKKVSGSFSFDENPDEEYKLINIEAQNSEWHIYSTTSVNVISDSTAVDNQLLKANSYYTIKRGENVYLIYVTDAFDNSFTPFSYREDINLIIGNDESCNIRFPIKYLNSVVAKVVMEDGKLALTVLADNVYLNNIAVTDKEKKHTILPGDELNIYGLRIAFMNGFLLANNPTSCIQFDYNSSLLFAYNTPQESEKVDTEVKDVDLYTKEQYFSKSPRLRRVITPKEIEFSQPPKQSSDKGKMPAILTISSTLLMGVSASMMLVNNLNTMLASKRPLSQAWPTLVTPIAMMFTTLVIPTITKIISKKMAKDTKADVERKYNEYLQEKESELSIEAKLQEEILFENLNSIDECLTIIENGKLNFWDKRIEQSDFLDVRLGIGNEPLKVDIKFPKDEFTIEESELKNKVYETIEKFKYIKNVPVGYSFYKSKLTAIMGEPNKCYGMIHNIILQLITYYSYDDIKIVIFTNKQNEDKWKYIRYLNHSFSNDKNIRFFSSNLDNAKILNDYLSGIIKKRIATAGDKNITFKPYYIVITDDYSQMKNLNINQLITETDVNTGFSMIILEQQLSRLPSKCNNFINLGASLSGILKNSYEKQESIDFRDEIRYDVDMMKIARKLSNIPIEFEGAAGSLPDSITFLEMEKAGKVEQLNIMNRWDSNDSTTSLKAEVGVDENGNLMYLDLHEKFHGPHGLVAGMTGSGKSEFIITYILSMAINYSPDDVAFILIDYKGGGLAGAFENKVTGVCLPHLVGTITNLDKAEMNRTLVSIDSEVKRRQKVFNDARDELGESTIDIYKYQRFFKEGRLKNPVPHLFIICDEFAELKSQQPEFMDNLISIARIGRSLGVHLILATQKPSGVVNDQIWSNTKFRVCLKVQTAADSKEMLKREDAASLKQTGRFYLQVGYDEYFALGQSGWCGAKYYPSEKIVKQIDKSICVIDEAGNVIKKINPDSTVKLEAQGEQLAAVMNSIIEVSKIQNKKAKRLWLNDIEPIILVNNLEQKYGFKGIQYDITAIIGEYDAPERQSQGLVTYALNKDGNTAIYGNDEMEREKLLNAIIYSICKWHTAKEVNIYIIDYGSEQLNMFNSFPQVGGISFLGEDEKIKNLIKLIINELKDRKKKLIPYGGSIETYNAKNEVKLPTVLLIINNYENLIEVYRDLSDTLITIARECERYGIVIALTSNNPSTLGRRLVQSFGNTIGLHMTDQSDYYSVFNMNVKIRPKNIPGRGLINNGGIHQFQTATIVPENQSLVDYLLQVSTKVKEVSKDRAKQIPSLPEKVTFDIIENQISNLQSVPIGIYKDSLSMAKHDFMQFSATTISSTKINNINSFMESLLEILIRINGLNIYFIDTGNILPQAANKAFNENKVNYISSNFDEYIDKLTDYEKNKHKNQTNNVIYVIYGLEKLKQKADTNKVGALFKEIKNSENSRLVLCEGNSGFKALDFDNWYTPVKNNTDGIWVGSGFDNQQTFRTNKITKDMSAPLASDYGFYLNEGNAEIIKLLAFSQQTRKEDDNNEK